MKLDYPIPEHALNLGYALGGLSTVLFCVLLVTGTALSMMYVPDPGQAHASVRAIIGQDWSAVLRSLHSWSAEAFLVVIVLHITRIVMTKSFLNERKWTWFVGLLLLGVAGWNFFSGTVLEWDQEAYEAYAHQMAAFELFPGGGYLGSFFEGELLLQRMFVLHVVVGPMLILVLMATHFLLVKMLSISPRLPGRDRPPSKRFSQHLRRLSGWGLALFGVLLFLAAVWEPAHMISPWSGVEWTKPPWPFYGLYFLESVFGLSALVWGPAGVFGGLALLPFLARRTPKPDRSTLIFLVGLFLYLVVSLYVAVTPPVQHLG